MRDLRINIAKKTDGIFPSLLLLTVFFVLLEISFFIQCNKSYLGDFSFITYKIQIPYTIIPGILFFILAQLAIHLLYTVAVWLTTLSLADFFKWQGNRTFYAAFFIWLLGISVALLANQYYFPNSKFADLTSVLFFNIMFLKLTFIFTISLLSLIVFIAAINGLQKMLRKSVVILLFFSTVLFITIFYFFPGRSQIADGATIAKPNIIIVGVDSLRPDYLGFFGAENDTPFMDHFLNKAVVFSEAVTPLARTFPSWIGILTGEYPKQSTVRTNLTDQTNINYKNSLPAILKRNGYETIYATDETRFSNIDKKVGFDKILTPPIGLNDFLLGTFNDFPLSNLLINSPIGKWLFPYSYGNRSAFVTYEPNTFLRLMKSALSKTRIQPVFLTAHFCLPHYPYLSAEISAKKFASRERYRQSVLQVDRELSVFFTMLRREKLLDHAIVVLLSDHGEALELSGDRITQRNLYNKKSPPPRFYPPSIDNEDFDQSAGHGTDVLGLTQYHSLLAFKFYGHTAKQAKIIPGVVSLLSIKPTLLDLIHIRQPNSSLANILAGREKTLPRGGHIFLESDFSPASMRAVYPDQQHVLMDGIDLFRIDPRSTRLIVKDELYQNIIASKQYADIHDDWMLALYPQNKEYRMPILVNLITGQWTNDLNSNFAKSSPAAKMLAALRAFYGAEIGKIQS